MIKKLMEKPLIQQIMKFGVVGFLCFFIEYCLLIFMQELTSISLAWATGIAFTVSVIVNYKFVLFTMQI